MFRQINFSNKKEFDDFIASGLYDELRNEGLLISHREIDSKHSISNNFHKIIQLDKVPFISYPYEWSFSQLKDAALLTLKIQRMSLKHNMSLKDASAYNVQFINCRPIFIDTLSFEKYNGGEPWIAYKQFCQHFLAPLALMSKKDVGLNRLLRLHLDGIPLNLASKLLPLNTWYNFTLLISIHLHSKLQMFLGSGLNYESKGKISKNSLLLLLNNLESAINKMNIEGKNSQWSDYYSSTNYSKKSSTNKRKIVNQYLDKTKPKFVWDLGANTGEYSKIASKKGALTISVDMDPIAVENNYLRVRARGEKNILPLVIDITNTSPNIGWENEERSNFFSRGTKDLVLALALVHHLAIYNNIPLSKIAQYFSGICNTLIVEFIPKEDSKVRDMLTIRKDIFPNYNQVSFEKELSKYFEILDKNNIINSQRVLYLMKKRLG
jgi:ribosomal protein L11 methylase PrmA